MKENARLTIIDSAIPDWANEDSIAALILQAIRAEAFGSTNALKQTAYIVQTPG
jgi:hypothetical protein